MDPNWSGRGRSPRAPPAGFVPAPVNVFSAAFISAFAMMILAVLFTGSVPESPGGSPSAYATPSSLTSAESDSPAAP